MSARAERERGVSCRSTHPKVSGRRGGPGGIWAREAHRGHRRRKALEGACGKQGQRDLGSVKSHLMGGHGGHRDHPPGIATGVHVRVPVSPRGTERLDRSRWWAPGAPADLKSRLLGVCIGPRGYPGLLTPPSPALPSSRPLPRAAGAGPSLEDAAEAATWPWASLLQGEAALWEPACA